MIFIDNNGNYPRYIGDLLLTNRSWKNGDVLPEGWAQVNESPAPKAPKGQMAKEIYPANIDGAFYQNWEIIEIPDNYFDPVIAESERLQNKRNGL